MTDLLPYSLLITGTFILAGLVKGVTGLGLPTVSMGLLGLAMSPVQAAALLLVPSLVTNLWQLFTGPRFGALLRRLWGMMLGVVVGTLAGSGLIAGTAGHAATTALGGALALYGVVGLRKPRLRVPAAAEPLAGVVTGLVTGATGVFVVPAVPYLGSLALERDDLRWRTRCRQFASGMARLFGGRITRLGFKVSSISVSIARLTGFHSRRSAIGVRSSRPSHNCRRERCSIGAAA